MKNFVKSTKTWMFALLCVLFFSIGIKAEAAPGTVTNVKQTGHGLSAVQVEWVATTVGNPTEYIAKAYENQTCTGTPIATGSSYSTQVIIQGLSAGKTYYVQVVAIDKDKTEGKPSTAIEVVTVPNATKVTNLKQSKLETKKISLSWAAVDGANCYKIFYRKDGSSKFTTKETTGTSYKISGSTDSAYAVNVFPVRKNSKGDYTAENYTAQESELKSNPTWMYTTPKTTKTLKLASTGTQYVRSSKIATFSGKLSNAADGYQYELRGYNNKKIKTATTTTFYSKLIQIKSGIKQGQFMKIRIRPYVNVNHKKTYGKWSSYLWFAMTPKTVKAEITPSQRVEDGLNISWSKVKGATDYSVYVSRTSGGKYKKVATTKSTTYNFRTFNGSQLTGGTYYYYVIANKKAGGKTYKSDDSWYFSKGIRITWQ